MELTEETARALLGEIALLRGELRFIYRRYCDTCTKLLQSHNESLEDKGHCRDCAIVKPGDEPYVRGESKGCMHKGCGGETTHVRTGRGFVDLKDGKPPVLPTYCAVHARQLERAGEPMEPLNPTTDF